MSESPRHEPEASRPSPEALLESARRLAALLHEPPTEGAARCAALLVGAFAGAHLARRLAGPRALALRLADRGGAVERDAEPPPSDRPLVVWVRSEVPELVAPVVIDAAARARRHVTVLWSPVREPLGEAALAPVSRALAPVLEGTGARVTHTVDGPAALREAAAAGGEARALATGVEVDVARGGGGRVAMVVAPYYWDDADLAQLVGSLAAPLELPAPAAAEELVVVAPTGWDQRARVLDALRERLEGRGLLGALRVELTDALDALGTLRCAAEVLGPLRPDALGVHAHPSVRERTDVGRAIAELSRASEARVVVQQASPALAWALGEAPYRADAPRVSLDAPSWWVEPPSHALLAERARLGERPSIRAAIGLSLRAELHKRRSGRAAGTKTPTL